MHKDNTAIEKTFGALADRTRLAIIERLVLGEASLSDLAEPFDMSQTAVSKHVKILSDAGLVKVKKRGRTRFCEFLPDPMKQAEDWLESYQKFWSERLGDLASFLDQEHTDNQKNRRNKK